MQIQKLHGKYGKGGKFTTLHEMHAA